MLPLGRSMKDFSSGQLYLNFPFPRTAAAAPGVPHISASLPLNKPGITSGRTLAFSSKFIRLSVSQKFDSCYLRRRESECDVLKKKKKLGHTLRETRQNESYPACVALRAVYGIQLRETITVWSFKMRAVNL